MLKVLWELPYLLPLGSNYHQWPHFLKRITSKPKPWTSYLSSSTGWLIFSHSEKVKLSWCCHRGWLLIHHLVTSTEASTTGHGTIDTSTVAALPDWGGPSLSTIGLLSCHFLMIFFQKFSFVWRRGEYYIISSEQVINARHLVPSPWLKQEFRYRL